MSSFVRWEWLLPRLLSVAVLLLAVQYGFCVLVRSAMVRSGQAALGAKVELGHARVSLAGGQVDLHGLRVANPRQPMQNLLEADHCALDVEVSEVLRKRAVIDRGQITGLRFGTARDSTGALPQRGPSIASPVFTWLGEQSTESAQDWLQRLEQQFARDLVCQLESVRLTQQLVACWPEQYRQLKERVEQLDERSEALQSSFRSAQENPLRHADFFKRLPNEVASLREDFVALAAEIEKLPDVADADRRTIIAARKHDERLIREALRIEAIDASALTAYFLQDQWDAPLGELVSWIGWTRSLLHAEPRLPAAPRKRGEDMLFAGLRRAPDLLIRTLELQGAVRFNGQPISINGTLLGLSSNPAIHDEPIRLSLASKQPFPLRLQATLDRTRGVSRDEVLVDCQNLPLPAAVLGDADKFRLTIEPSTAALSVSLRLEGERLVGDIQIVQKEVAIVPQLGGELHAGAPGLAAALVDTLTHLNSVALRLSLSGTLDEPRCQLWSNLGPAVAESMDNALRRAADEQAARVLAVSQQQVDEQLANLERQLAEQQTVLLKSLDGPTMLLKRIAAEQNIPGRLPAELGRRLPSGSLFR